MAFYPADYARTRGMMGLSLAEPASRVRPLADDAGGDDKSREAKRQAVEKFVEKFDVATQWNESDLPVDESSAEFSANKLSELATNLKEDLFRLIAINLDGQSIIRMLSTCKTWRANGSSEFWEVLGKTHYPRLSHILACMPQPHPSWRQLYLQQLRAERPLRFEAAGVLPPTTTSLNDYFYSVEIYGEKNGSLLMAKYGPLGTTNGNGFCIIKLWDQADPPTWASKIVEDFRTKDGENDSAAWMDSDGCGIASLLRARIFITRPGGDTFCLYDGSLGRPSPRRPKVGLAIDDDNDDGSDIFDMCFENVALPLAGAAAMDSRVVEEPGIKGRYTILSNELEAILSLRSKGLHSDEDDPLHDPAKPNGNLAGDGELHLDFQNSDPDLRDDDIVRYFEWFAPF